MIETIVIGLICVCLALQTIELGLWRSDDHIIRFPCDTL